MMIVVPEENDPTNPLRQSIISPKKRLFYPKGPRVDPDGIESNSDDDIMYPNMGPT
jgi:hypothetical protein